MAASSPARPGARQRAVLTALIERIDVGADQIDMHFRPARLGALLDVVAPLPSASDDETQILSVPIRLRRAGRVITMRIDGTDPFATAKPAARIARDFTESRAAAVSSLALINRQFRRSALVGPGALVRPAALRSHRGTESSNPGPSSGESSKLSFHCQYNTPVAHLNLITNLVFNRNILLA